MRHSMLARLPVLCLGLLGMLSCLPANALTADQIQKLLPSDGATGSYFGASVAIDGDTAVIIADGFFESAEPLVYVYVRRDGAWTEQAILAPSGGDNFTGFGTSVAIEGDTAVIGLARFNDNVDEPGSVYVYTRSDGVWTRQAELQASDSSIVESFDERFGEALALDGDTLVIGAPDDGERGASAGAAYVFERSGDRWTEAAKLLPEDVEEDDSFGAAVAVDGDTALIGSPGDDNEIRGSAYVFRKEGGVWTEHEKLVPSSGAPGGFGSAVALDGDIALIGPRVFARGDTWSERTLLVPDDLAEVGGYGSPVSLDGNRVVIGAAGSTYNGRSSGAAFVFERRGGEWSDGPRVLPDDGRAEADFGDAVAIDGDTVLIGARRDGSDDGASYVFALSDGDPLECELPDIDPTVDGGVHVWRECDGETWNLMLSGVADRGTIRAAGKISSSLGLVDVTPVSIEGSDRLAFVRSNYVEFSFITAQPWSDRFQFKARPNDELCVALVDITDDEQLYVGAGRVMAGTGPINPETLERCRIADAPDCVTPGFDPRTESALMTWVDCDGVLHLLAIGGEGYGRFGGHVHASSSFTAIDARYFERSDTLTASDSSTVRFEMTSGNGARDEILLTPAKGASLCIDVSVAAPTGVATVYRGAAREVMTSAFDPSDGTPCKPPAERP